MNLSFFTKWEIGFHCDTNGVKIILDDEVQHPLTDADHQDSGAAVQCIPVIIIIIIISMHRHDNHHHHHLMTHINHSLNSKSHDKPCSYRFAPCSNQL